MKKKIIPLALLISCPAFTDNVAYPQDIILENDNEIYSVVEGSATDYYYTDTDIDGITNYYKIDLNTNNLSFEDNIVFDDIELSADYTDSIDIKLPNEQGKTIYYGYNKPNDYTSTSATTGITTDSVYHKVFENINRYGDGIAIHNEGDHSNIDITSDFLNNKNSRAYEDLFGGAIYNSGTIRSISGNFIKNEVSSSGASSETFGGAIYNSGTIDSITGNFIENSASASTQAAGSAIYNSGTINSISGNFVGNYTSSYANSGTIYNTRTINSISGNFVGNYVSSSTSVFGGAIYNSHNNSRIESIKSNFIGNHVSSTSSIYGSAIANNSGIITSITGDFICNSAVAINSGNVFGGAIYNYSTNGLNIINSSFIGNNVSVRIGDGAKGGAIYTSADLAIKADNGVSLFRGNYVQLNESKDQQAIYVSSNTATLTLNSINNGEIIMDDKISGVSRSETSAYNIKIIGDDTSTVELNNSIYNANVSLDNTNLYIGEYVLADSTTNTNINSGTVHLANGKTENYQINKLISDPNANYRIDVDNSIKLAPVPDTIVVGANSSGKITISDIEMQNSSNEFNVQVLYAENDNIQLQLSDELLDKFNTTTVEKLYTSDEMKSDVWWDEQFHTYEQDKNITSTITLDTTTTTNDSIKYTQESTLGAIVDTGSYGDTLALISQYDNVVEDRNFNFDTENDVYEVTQNLGTTSAGTLNINGVANGDQSSTIDGNSLALFTLNNETNLNINNTKITGAQSVVTGYNKDAVLTLNNVEIKDNTNGIETAGSIYVKGNSSFENNGEGIKVTSSSSVITIDATASEITLKDKLSGVSGAKLNLKGGPVNFEKEVSVLDVTMSEALGNLRKDNVFNGLNLTVDKQSTINMANNTTSIMSLNNLTLNDNLDMHVDVDLANRSMDRIIANNYNVGNYFVNVTKMNMLSDSDSVVTKVLFADDNLKNNVSTTVSEVVYSPIWKYGVTYDKTDGQFTFTRGGGSSPVQPAPTIDTLNPSLMVSPVAAQLGGYMGMLDTYANAFTHMDMNMLKSSSVRFAEANANKYAVADVSPRAYYSNEMNSKGIWFKPYTSYDSVGLKNGPKVSSFSYGSFIGGDSELHKFKNGFSGVISPYIAYQGSHQSFRGNSVYQNGGTIGLTGTLYKGNFFTGLTAGIGASVADANTMYGHEDFPMLMSGIASKTGYNFEFKDGRYIIQPSLLLSYTFVNTFNYTNNTSVSIDSDPLHAIQILPSVRFVMNTKNGWQPYLTAGMNWNILDETKVTANMTSLPQMSMKPYVQYGVGVQRTMKDRLTAYLQVVLRHGGRNGIAATGGLRYMFGKEPIKYNRDL